MAEPHESLPLGAEFPVADREEWTEAVAKVLRGRPVESLATTTRDGIDIQALYTREDLSAGGRRGEPGPAPAGGAVVPGGAAARVDGGWDVRQVHSTRGRDAADCCRDLIGELERGVTSVELEPPEHGWDTDRLRAVTEGVLLDLAPVALAPHAHVDWARSLDALIGERGDRAATRSWLGLDPIGEVTRGAPVPDEADVDAVIAAAAELAPRLPRGRTVTVDTTRYVDAGATEAQELAWGVATGVAYLRAFERAGVEPADAAATIAFRVSAGADQFLTMATLRAGRRLWQRVLEACGVAAGSPQAVQAVQAVTSRTMFSTRDPWVNMLRVTTAALAAGTGGADAVTVLPFDDALGAPDNFARRVARNTQLLLIEESHLAQVIDPAAGSWFVETLTERLADTAWAQFQEVEARGGMRAALADGAIREAVDAAWHERLAALGTRRASLTGVSEFPDLDEEPVVRPDRDERDGWPLRRLAAPFEVLRDAADRMLATEGRRPSVHLATLGDLATHTARSTWITNLVAVAGVAVEGGDVDGASSPIEAEARFAESGARVAIVCSSDGVYAERAAATVTALREAGAERVILAGGGGDLREALESAGVDEFWHAGMDVLDALRRLHRVLGVLGEPGA